jgi:aryl-alcohol dehydrogenase-like predicted oxidoreductase
MSELCRAFNVKLLAYGTLAGGMLTDAMRGQRGAEEQEEEGEGKGEGTEGKEGAEKEVAWSVAKYRRFLHAGGVKWSEVQGLLDVLHGIAQKHHGQGVSVANVAARWVLQQSHVAAVIVGSHLQHTAHVHDNLRVGRS